MQFADIFYSKKQQTSGDIGKLQGKIKPAIDRVQALNVDDNDVIYLKTVDQHVTEGTELIGLTPYGKLDTEDILFHIQSAIHIDTHMKKIGKEEGFSCFSVPEVQLIGADRERSIQIFGTTNDSKRTHLLIWKKAPAGAFLGRGPRRYPQHDH